MQRNSHKILRPWPETLRVECNIASRHDFADIVRWCLHEKAGISDIFVAVVDNPDLLRKLSRDGEYELRAAVFPCAVAHAYQLIVDSPTPEMAVHECVHIWQFERGDLARMPDGAYSWKGALWPKTAPYRSRPWEREAFDLQDRWWKEYREGLKRLQQPW